jgi:hypothetical protein
MPRFGSGVSHSSTTMSASGLLPLAGCHSIGLAAGLQQLQVQALFGQCVQSAHAASSAWGAL